VTGFELPAADAGVQITTGPDASWKLTATYVDATKTPWAHNSRGLTYGVVNGDGSPDLIAVVTDDGQAGYVYADQLAEADGDAAARRFRSPAEALTWQEKVAGTVVRVPVYESDGKTRVGEFTVQR
jgi:hypothetical protein